MSALLELDEAAGEPIQYLVFGAWGWGSPPPDGNPWAPGYDEPDPPPVPFDKRGVVLTREEAAPLMEGWGCDGGYGAPKCYALRAWSASWVLWIAQYDGYDGPTSIDLAARYPVATMPDMPGR